MTHVLDAQGRIKRGPDMALTYLQLTCGNDPLTAGLEINAATADEPVLILQTTDDDATNPTLEIQDSGGVSVAEIEADGTIRVAADGPDYRVGDTLAFWLDAVKRNAFIAGAGNKTLTGNKNFAMGSTAGESLTTGIQNVLVGPEAGKAMTTAQNNFALGFQALLRVTNARGNIAIGALAGWTLTSGASNIFIGMNAGVKTTGYENIFVGRDSGHENTTGHGNIFIGYRGGYGNTTHRDSVLIGNNVGGTTFGLDNILAIHNADIATPLIFGDFANDWIRLHANTALTNSVHNLFQLRHLTSGIAVAGLGLGIEFQLEENDGTNRIAGIIENLWTDAGEGANADADFVFKLMENDGAAAEKGRLTSGGDWKIPGDYYSGGSQGLSGTLTLDDGANWRITLTWLGGILTGQTTGATVGATAAWA